MDRMVLVACMAGMLAVSFAVGLAVVENQASAQTTNLFSREKVISVTGVATASVEPDLLILVFGVQTQERTAEAALAANSESMNAAVSAVSSLGISPDDLSTSRFDIHPVYEGYRENDAYRQELAGYQVANTLRVETDRLDLAAEIIDAAVGAGANRVDDVRFTLAPETHLEIKDGLIEMAVLDARAKATSALEPLDHVITGVKAVSLSESGISPDVPAYAFEDSVMGLARSASAPVFSSDQDVTTTVNVVFLIGAG